MHIPTHVHSMKRCDPRTRLCVSPEQQMHYFVYIRVSPAPSCKWTANPRCSDSNCPQAMKMSTRTGKGKPGPQLTWQKFFMSRRSTFVFSVKKKGCLFVGYSTCSKVLYKDRQNMELLLFTLSWTALFTAPRGVCSLLKAISYGMAYNLPQNDNQEGLDKLIGSFSWGSSGDFVKGFILRGTLSRIYQ